MLHAHLADGGAGRTCHPAGQPHRHRMLTVYAYRSCSTCRAGIARLKQHGVAFTELPIREQPPTVAELRRVLAAVGGDIRRLFNTSGQDYRELGISKRLPTLTTDQALALLTSNGNLCKRPVVLGPNVALVGFKPDEWSAAGL
jgi:arsenate reductase (glutaredoxin)